MTVQNPPIFLQASSHPAEDTRRALGSLLVANGVVATGDLAVTQNGTPNMTVNVAGGRVAIAGSEATYQGTYLCENRGTTNLVIAASDATNPRIDLVVAKVQDAGYSGATNAWSLAVVTGTPAASPAVPTAPANSMIVAQIAVGATVTTILTANITDKRTRAAGLGGRVTCTAATRPSAPFAGLEIYETDTGRFLAYDGSNWIRTGWLTSAGRTEFRATATATAAGDTAVVAVPWGTEVADTDSFSPASTTITIPSGQGGLYAITVKIQYTVTFSSTVPPTFVITAGGATYRFAIQAAFGEGGGGIVIPLAATNTITVDTYQNSGSGKTISTTSAIAVVRIGA